MLQLGTIILTSFLFTDLSSTKRRPAIVISEVNSSKTDVIVAFISSVIPTTTSPTDFVLTRTHPDFSKTDLLKNSVFKMDKLATLDQRIFTGELGEVTATILEELQNCLRIGLCLEKNKMTTTALKSEILKISTLPSLWQEIENILEEEREKRNAFYEWVEPNDLLQKK